MLQNGSAAIILKDTGYKGNTWGFRGDRVTVISISGNAVIVENQKGLRFPCNIKELAIWNQELERSLRRVEKSRSGIRKR